MAYTRRSFTFDAEQVAVQFVLTDVCGMGTGSAKTTGAPPPTLSNENKIEPAVVSLISTRVETAEVDVFDRINITMS